MLNLTKKADYALVAMAALAHRHEQAIGPISARELAEQYHLPLPLLMNVLKDLAKAHLANSIRGSKGGYELHSHPERISVLEVIRAVEGPFQLSQCCSGLPILNQRCEIDESCPIREPIQKIHRKLYQTFEQWTLNDLIHDQEPATV